MVAACVAVVGLVGGCSTSTQNRPVVGAPTSTSAAAGSASLASEPQRVQAVDPGLYEESGTYYFQSPTKTFKCAIVAPGSYDPGVVAGCQGPTTPVPAAQRDCWAKWGPYGSGVGVGPSGAQYLCLNQGFFVGAPLNPGDSEGGGRVLPYGSSLSARGYTCTSATDGVSCANDANGHGFRIARQANSVY